MSDPGSLTNSHLLELVDEMNPDALTAELAYRLSAAIDEIDRLVTDVGLLNLEIVSRG